MTPRAESPRRGNRRTFWLILGLLWAGGLALGYIGLARNAEAATAAGTAGGPATPLDLVYRTLQLTVLEYAGLPEGGVPWQLEAARFALPALTAWTAIRALLSVFHDRWQLFLVRRWRDHAIICGLSRKGWLLAQGFAARGDRVVVIERDEAHAMRGPCRELGIPWITGDASESDVLQQAGVQRARHLLALTDDDGVNVEIAVRAQALLQSAKRPTALTCTVHLVDPRLHELARTRELSLEEGVALRLELFNIFHQGARMLWSRFGPPAAPTEAPSAPVAGTHLLVVGLGRLGESLVVWAGRDWHARLHTTPPSATGRLRITVIDLHADWKCQSLSLRYPQLAAVADLIPLTLNVYGPQFYQAGFLDTCGGTVPPVSAAFVCFDDDSLGLRTGLALHQLLLRSSNGCVPVVVRMTESSGLARLVDPDGNGAGPFANLHAFGLVDATCTPEAVLGGTHEALARGMHEAYVAQQRAAGATETDNPSIRPWAELPEVLRESNRGRAGGILRHLTDLGYAVAPLTDWDGALFRLTEPEVLYLAEREHERFVAERSAQGWRPTSGEKNTVARRNPALVPWAELPEAERAKTCDTVRRLPATLALTGFQIIRAAPAVPVTPPDGAAPWPPASPCDAREVMARTIHERYRQNQRGVRPPHDPALQPWETLSEALRESSRQQADDIAQTLARFGYGVRPATGESAAPSFTEAEVEAMAEVTHEHWMEERRQAGWVQAPERNVAHRTTPYLVPYAELPDDVKELDRQAVRAIPEVLAAAGLEIYAL